MSLLYLYYFGMLKVPIPSAIQGLIVTAVLGATVSAFVALIKVFGK